MAVGARHTPLVALSELSLWATLNSHCLLPAPHTLPGPSPVVVHGNEVGHPLVGALQERGRDGLVSARGTLPTRQRRASGPLAARTAHGGRPGGPTAQQLRAVPAMLAPRGKC